MKWPLIPLMLAFCTTCVPLGTTTPSTQRAPKPIQYDDVDYEKQVGLVWINFNRPLIRLSEGFNIQTSFDLFATEFENLQARLIHCNRDWTPSVLPEMDYLEGFNQLEPKSFTYSVNTQRPYIQYLLDVPCPKLTGNYVLAVHRRNDPSDLLFTRRFIVHSDEVELNGEIRTPPASRLKRSHQQVDFEMRYGRLNSPNPAVDFYAVIVQNTDFRRAIYGLAPTQIRPDNRQMVWKYFNSEHVFPGWNQFRFADLTSLTVRGFNIREIRSTADGMAADLLTDKSKGKAGYTQLINDRNGNFLPVNKDRGETQAEAAYVRANFELFSERPIGDVFVMGRFNHWQKNRQNLMQYDAATQTYQWQTQLKQGIYDYRYEVVTDSLPVWHLEGSHFQAENRYDVIIYYRNPQNPYDEVVGRLTLNSASFF